MESAIDHHLRCPRELSRRVSDAYTPDYPRYVARADRSLAQVVMGSFGVQHARPGQRPGAMAALCQIVATFGLTDGPRHHDLSHHVDGQGHHNLMAVAYWTDPAAYRRWLASPGVAQWWESEDRLGEGLGYFREIVAPRVEQFETLYAANEDLRGVGAALTGCSGEVREHGYWGSSRDRIPLSQTDRLESVGVPHVVSGDPAAGGRVVVRGHHNLVVIRSGQLWEGADEDEHNLYVEHFLPTLEVGMAALEREGTALGCYSNRFVRSIDLDGNELDETYNVGYWRALSNLERWAETSRAHLQLFVRFQSVHARLDRLRFYQEVSVSDREDQTFEYLNCHRGTGLMRDAAVPVDAGRHR